jgi:hypothetical protein
MDLPYYDRNGEAIDAATWGMLHAQDTYRQVGSTTIGPYLISTVWLGIDHGFGRQSGPVIFETMVFKGNEADDQYTERYTTIGAAERGHSNIVGMVEALSSVKEG